MNRPWDEKNQQTDKSQMSEEKKVYDTKGNWVNDYDSVLLGPAVT